MKNSTITITIILAILLIPFANVIEKSYYGETISYSWMDHLASGNQPIIVPFEPKALIITDKPGENHNHDNITNYTLFIHPPFEEPSDRWIAIEKLDNGKIQFYTKDFRVMEISKKDLINFLSE